MNTKYILLACIMAVSVMPMYAQGDASPSVEPQQSEITNPSQKKESIPPKEHSSSSDKNKLGRNGNYQPQNVADKDINDNAEAASRQALHTDETDGMESRAQDENKGFDGIETGNRPVDNVTYNASEYYAPQPQGEEQFNWGLIAIFLAIIALCIAGYNYITLQPKKSKRNSRISSHQDSTNSDRDIQSKIIRLTNDYQGRISQLTNRVEDLETQLNRVLVELQNSAKTSVHSDDSLNSSAQNGCRKNHGSGEVKLYASQVASGLFPEEGLAEVNSDYTIAILTIKGDNGTYIINDQVSAQTFLITNFAYSAGRVSDVKQQGNSPTRIETIQPGRISRQGNAWKITANAQVRLV